MVKLIIQGLLGFVGVICFVYLLEVVFNFPVLVSLMTLLVLLLTKIVYEAFIKPNSSKVDQTDV